MEKWTSFNIWVFKKTVWNPSQDNDLKHSSSLVKNWFCSEQIPVFDWPAQSPDLNPIENSWNEVKVEIAKKML